MLFIAYLYSAGTQHGNLHPAGWPILFCGPTQEPCVSHSQKRKNRERFWKKCRWMDRNCRNKQARKKSLAVSVACMHCSPIQFSFALFIDFLMLFTSQHFSDPSALNLFFLSSLFLSHRSRISPLTQVFFFWRCLPRISLATSVTAVLKVVNIESVATSSSVMMVRGANFPPVIPWKVSNTLGAFSFRGQT